MLQNIRRRKEAEQSKFTHIPYEKKGMTKKRMEIPKIKEFTISRV